jgi:hypothetical protein
MIIIAVAQSTINYLKIIAPICFNFLKCTFHAFEPLTYYNNGKCDKKKQNIYLIMAPIIMGTQLILNVGLQLIVSTMVPQSAQPRKTLGE